MSENKKTCGINIQATSGCKSIVSYLGRLDREADMKAAESAREANTNEKDDYDPWAGIGNIL